VRGAVAPDYDTRLWSFLQARNSQLSRLIGAEEKITAAASQPSNHGLAGVISQKR
jgi:hypothetical protein